MRVFWVASFLATFAGIASAQQAGPFGVKMGAPVTEYAGYESEFGQTILVPKKHPTFIAYIAHSTPAIGVCLVRGQSTEFPAHYDEGGNKGQELRDLFAKIRAQLDTRYGESDFHETFSLFPYGEDWITQIARDEKKYQASWYFETPQEGTGVKEIILYLHGTGSPGERAFLRLQYAFDNYDKCAAERDRQRKAVEDADAENL